METLTLDPGQAAYLQRALPAWFAREARDLPWRRRRTLYGTWVAEMMLQQTSVAAAAPYWERFMARWPDVAALAAAEESEVLAAWSGLGYYRRARHLHAAARLVVAAGGRLPADHDGWRALPGVGDYAAGAVASLGLGVRVPAVDANARRVLLRWSCDDPAAAGAVPPRRLAALAAELVPVREPGAWNEGLMELGALVCRAGVPACDACPVRQGCRAGRAGAAAHIPPPRPRPRATAVALGALVLSDGRRVLLLPAEAAPALVPAAWGAPARRDLAALHRGLWGPPVTAWYEPAACGDTVAAWRAWLRGHGLARVPLHRVGDVRHAITRWRLEVRVTAGRVGPARLEALAADVGGLMATSADDPPRSRLAAKILAQCGLTVVDSGAPTHQFRSR